MMQEVDLEGKSESQSLLPTKPKQSGIFNFIHRNILQIQAALWMVVYIVSEVQFRNELKDGDTGAEVHFAASALGTIGALWIMNYSIYQRKKPEKEDLKYNSLCQYSGDVVKRMLTPPLPCFQDVDLRRFFATSFFVADVFAVISYGMLGKGVTAWDITFTSGTFILETTALAFIPKKESAYIAFGLIVGGLQAPKLIGEIISPEGRVPFLITNIAMVTSSAFAIGDSIASHIDAIKEAKGVCGKAKAVILG